MCHLEALLAWFLSCFSDTNQGSNQNIIPQMMTALQQEENTTLQTIARFSNNFTILVPIPIPSQACTLLQKYQKSHEFKYDQNFGSSELLFYLVLKNLIEESSESPKDIERELAHVSGQTWRSAKIEFKDSYEMLVEDENIKKYLEN